MTVGLDVRKGKACERCLGPKLVWRIDIVGTRSFSLPCDHFHCLILTAPAAPEEEGGGVAEALWGMVVLPEGTVPVALVAQLSLPFSIFYVPPKILPCALGPASGTVFGSSSDSSLLLHIYDVTFFASSSNSSNENASSSDSSYTESLLLEFFQPLGPSSSNSSYTGGSSSDSSLLSLSSLLLSTL